MPACSVRATWTIPSGPQVVYQKSPERRRIEPDVHVEGLVFASVIMSAAVSMAVIMVVFLEGAAPAERHSDQPRCLPQLHHPGLSAELPDRTGQRVLDGVADHEDDGRARWRTTRHAVGRRQSTRRRTRSGRAAGRALDLPPCGAGRGHRTSCRVAGRDQEARAGLRHARWTKDRQEVPAGPLRGGSVEMGATRRDDRLDGGLRDSTRPVHAGFPARPQNGGREDPSVPQAVVSRWSKETRIRRTGRGMYEQT